jgi:RHS repeat-associated protein
MDRLLSQDAAGSVTRYTYNAAGQLTGAVSPTSTLTMERDAMGQLVAETVDGRTSRYTYDPLGRRRSRTTPTGAVSTLEYSAAGDRVRVTTDGHTMAFSHDVLGRELSRSWGTPATPVALTTAWDIRGRPIGQSLTAGDVLLRGRDYGYRADNYPLSITESTRTTRRDTHISLDPLGRPLSVEAPKWQENYTYDSAGNQTSAEWPQASGHADARGQRGYDGGRLVSAGSVHYEYDAAGRVVLRRRTRLSRKPDIWRYTYDAEDRLTSCTTPDGALWHYTYDPLGRRTAKHRMAADGLSAVETVRFTWDGTQLAEQAEQSGTARSTVVSWEYEGHRPLSQYERRMRGQDEVDARFFAIVSDLVGTPTELVSESGETAWRSRSTCWGTTSWNKGATAYTPLRFPGQYADAETGLHYNYFRHYDPDTARYTSCDPLGLAPAPNPSTYVLNPWAWTDPLGLAPKRCQMDAYDWKGSIRYGRLDHLGRPTGVNAQLRPEMLHTGTAAGSLRPPGWRGNGTDFNEARGHLLADRLGGPGTGTLAYHNLVTQTQNPTNSPDQRDQVEQKIYDAVHRGETVQYNIKPVYEGSNPIPIRIEFTAFGNNGFTFKHHLDNPAAGVRTGV